MADRKATATWQGDLFGGGGKVTAASSGLFTDAAVTWASRTEAPGGRTSPEELIASAHASCFSMALSNVLASQGHVPAQVDVDATCTFEGGSVISMVLDVVASVPGASEDDFREGVSAAELSCPVSKALRGNVVVTVTAVLR